jgi:hypothetical protein
MTPESVSGFVALNMSHHYTTYECSMYSRSVIEHVLATPTRVTSKGELEYMVHTHVLSRRENFASVYDMMQLIPYNRSKLICIDIKRSYCVHTQYIVYYVKTTYCRSDKLSRLTIEHTV